MPWLQQKIPGFIPTQELIPEVLSGYFSNLCYYLIKTQEVGVLLHNNWLKIYFPEKILDFYHYGCKSKGNNYCNPPGRGYSKDEILRLYLNTVPFGENTYGMKLQH